MTGILSRKASAPFSGSSNPPVGRRQLSPLEYGGMVVAGLPPESNALVRMTENRTFAGTAARSVIRYFTRASSTLTPIHMFSRHGKVAPISRRRSLRFVRI